MQNEWFWSHKPRNLCDSELNGTRLSMLMVIFFFFLICEAGLQDCLNPRHVGPFRDEYNYRGFEANVKVYYFICFYLHVCLSMYVKGVDALGGQAL